MVPIFIQTLMWIPAGGIHVLWLTNSQDYGVLWRKRDSTATLARGEHPDPCLDRLLLLFWALCTGSL